jgi:hypothetical protein
MIVAFFSRVIFRSFCLKERYFHGWRIGDGHDLKRETFLFEGRCEF